MSRLIDADRLRELLKDDWVQIPPVEENRDVFYHNSGYNCAAFRAYLLVDKQPTVDPVVHGRWEEVKNAHGELEGWQCACGRFSVEKSFYCPNCGANMD